MVKLCPRRAFWEASRLVDHWWLTKYTRINLHLQSDSYNIHHIPEGILKALPTKSAAWSRVC